VERHGLKKEIFFIDVQDSCSRLRLCGTRRGLSISHKSVDVVEKEEKDRFWG